MRPTSMNEPDKTANKEDDAHDKEGRREQVVLDDDDHDNRKEEVALQEWRRKREEKRKRSRNEEEQEEEKQQIQDDEVNGPLLKKMMMGGTRPSNHNNNKNSSNKKDQLETKQKEAEMIMGKDEEPSFTTATATGSRDGIPDKGGDDKKGATRTKNYVSGQDIREAAATAVEQPDGTHHTSTLNRDEEGVPTSSTTTSTTATTTINTMMDRLEVQRQIEEARIMKEASQIQTNALQGAKELASGVVYDTPMPSSWTIPKFYIQQQQYGSDGGGHAGTNDNDNGPAVRMEPQKLVIAQRQWDKIRKEWHIQTQGDHIPPPMKRFVDMKFPLPILKVLEKKHIHLPTPIQMQGLPVALSGRDMVGIAFTGSGKTLTFTLPMIMLALEEEMRMPIIAQEGPIGIVLAPSRELARQTFDLVQEFTTEISKTPHYPEIRAQLIMGGESVRDQLSIVQQKGIHCVVATPGRLRDVLKRRSLNLHICRYICLDEADRMLDMGFDEEVSDIINFFVYQRQTLLFSATFPQKFQDFCRKTLVQPIIVNVGRAGAANLDVIQEVEYVKEEAKIVYLLHCLQKTAPPVIIFCERKGSADDIHEYLLLKGVEAVCIHGGKDQEERNEAIRLFKEGMKDVLIATDVAAKGLDFPAIQHVINFDMPPEIESYVHRIGRTGRAGKTGVATSFINKSCDETTLLDLKALLREAKQRIPPVLMILDDPREQQNGAGCSFCGGLGHTIVDCPKIDKDARRVAGSHRDVLAASGGDW